MVRILLILATAGVMTAVSSPAAPLKKAATGTAVSAPEASPAVFPGHHLDGSYTQPPSG